MERRQVDWLSGSDSHCPEAACGVACLDRKCRFSLGESICRWFLGCPLYSFCAEANPEIILWFTWRFSGNHGLRFPPDALGREYYRNCQETVNREKLSVSVV